MALAKLVLRWAWPTNFVALVCELLKLRQEQHLATMVQF